PVSAESLYVVPLSRTAFAAALDSLDGKDSTWTHDYKRGTTVDTVTFSIAAPEATVLTEVFAAATGEMIVRIVWIGAPHGTLRPWPPVESHLKPHVFYRLPARPPSI